MDDFVVVIVVTYLLIVENVFVDMVFDDDVSERFCCVGCPDVMVSRSRKITDSTYQHRYLIQFTHKICG